MFDLILIFSWSSLKQERPYLNSWKQIRDKEAFLKKINAQTSIKNFTLDMLSKQELAPYKGCLFALIQQQHKTLQIVYDFYKPIVKVSVAKLISQRQFSFFDEAYNQAFNNLTTCLKKDGIARNGQTSSIYNILVTNAKFRSIDCFKLYDSKKTGLSPKNTQLIKAYKAKLKIDFNTKLKMIRFSAPSYEKKFHQEFKFWEENIATKNNTYLVEIWIEYLTQSKQGHIATYLYNLKWASNYEQERFMELFFCECSSINTHQLYEATPIYSQNSSKAPSFHTEQYTEQFAEKNKTWYARWNESPTRMLLIELVKLYDKYLRDIGYKWLANAIASIPFASKEKQRICIEKYYAACSGIPHSNIEKVYGSQKTVKRAVQLVQTHLRDQGYLVDIFNV